MSGHGGKQLGYTGQQRLEELVSQSSGSPVLCGPGLSDSKSHSHRWHPLLGGRGALQGEASTAEGRGLRSGAESPQDS